MWCKTEEESSKSYNKEKYNEASYKFNRLNLGYYIKIIM
jgi:hypothetical protein